MLNLTASDLAILTTAMEEHAATVWNKMRGPVTDEWQRARNLADRCRAELEALPAPTTIEG